MKKDITLRARITAIFIIYLIIISLYAMIYEGVYISRPSSFVFNDDVLKFVLSNAYEKEKQILISEILPAFRNPKMDTVVMNGKVIINTTYHTFEYLVGKDTVLIRDSLSIPGAASKLVNLYELYGIKRIWDQFDFLYFSTITISTVGYGDILPNSTTVRMIVVSEVLLGQIVLVVFLNFVLTDIRKGRQLTNHSN
jgi:hypothetical protein